MTLLAAPAEGSVGAAGAAPHVAVCAMGKRPFDDIGRRWLDRLAADGAGVTDARATVRPRSAVVDAISGGVDVVLYAGHGRDRGWSGYQTVRARHLDAVVADRSPTVVFAFACRTAAPGGFGEFLVASGLVRAYVGWACDLPADPGLRLADRIVARLGTGGRCTVGNLLTEVRAEVVDPDEHRCLDGCRVLGESSAPLRRPPSSAHSR